MLSTSSQSLTNSCKILMLTRQSRPTPTNSSHQAVFFVVTNIDHDTLADNGNDLPGSNMHIGSVVGELGCWVDPLVTRMIQSGVEHLRVPNVTEFMGISSSKISQMQCRLAHYSFVALHIVKAPVVSPDDLMPGGSANHQAFHQMLALASVAFTSQASTYDLPISILLKGARGIGKFTTASWVAQSLGMHLFEVRLSFPRTNGSQTDTVLR